MPSVAMFEKLKRQFSEATARGVADFFSNIRLPIPEEDECQITKDSGAILFNNVHAVVIRITPAGLSENVNHPLMLQPLATRFTDLVKIDINPGVECPAHPRDTLAAYNALKEKGWLLRDMKPQNLGNISSAAFQANKTAALVIDPGAVAKISPNMFLGSFRKRRIFNLILSLGRPSCFPLPDQSIFNPLREAFENAWPAGSVVSNPEKMEKFWLKCKDMKEKSWLVCGWLSNPKVVKSNYKNARDGSRKYQKRLISHFL
jgi:hypothetical protein